MDCQDSSYTNTQLEHSTMISVWSLTESSRVGQSKGPPETSCVKRLAVAVDDHAIDYIDFEGTIPEGQYGAGKVEIWDKGTFDLTNRTETAISLAFHGKRLEGDYHLIRIKDNRSCVHVGFEGNRSAGN